MVNLEIKGDIGRYRFALVEIKANSVVTYLRHLLLAFCFLNISQTVKAQQFEVTGFQQLPHDLSASVSPAYDLNDEACALVKVVCPSDFVFSTPLGVVKRVEKVGEVWLYLPRGSRRITLKHPRWGVLRDYPFSKPLASKQTYELRVQVPLEASKLPLLGKPVGIRVESRLESRIDCPYEMNLPKIRIPWKPFAMLACGVTDWKQPSFGLRAGVVRKHGFFLSVQSDLHAIPSTDGDCNRYGIPPGQVLGSYDTGRIREGRFMLMGGAMHPVLPRLYIYEALGYGCHTVAWEKVDGSWLRNTYYSANGWCAEAGVLYRFSGRFLLSAGVQTIAASHWEGTVGFGYQF